jgi:hypothetical protein
MGFGRCSGRCRLGSVLGTGTERWVRGPLLGSGYSLLLGSDGTQGYCYFSCPSFPLPGPPPPDQSLPGGTNVSFHWTDETGGYVTFSVSGPGPHASTVTECFWYNDTGGACYFTPIGGIYSFHVSNVEVFESPQFVNYTGSYLT